MLLAISFVGRLLTAGSGSYMFQSYHPWLHDILSLLAKLHASPCLTLHCVLLFNSLSLVLSDFQEEVNVDTVPHPATCVPDPPLYHRLTMLFYLPIKKLNIMNLDNFLKSPNLSTRKKSRVSNDAKLEVFYLLLLCRYYKNFAYLLGA